MDKENLFHAVYDHGVEMRGIYILCGKKNTRRLRTAPSLPKEGKEKVRTKPSLAKRVATRSVDGCFV